MTFKPAAAVIHAIAGDRRDLYLGWPERFFVRLNSLLPLSLIHI